MIPDLTIPPDRRRSPRHVEIKPAKVYDQRAEKYFAAETCNVSGTGTLIKVNRAMPIAAGDILSVGIQDDNKTDRLIRRDEMIRARVVRVIPIDQRSQAVALQFAGRVADTGIVLSAA